MKIKTLNNLYPFDGALRSHLLIALGLAIWVFVFLYFTEPLDVDEFGATEKLIYLPGYGLLGATCYLLSLPFQKFLFTRNKQQWFWREEILFLLFFLVCSFLVVRGFYLYVVMIDIPNPYTLGYYFRAIFFPAVLTILPIVIIGRWAFGKYKNKKLEDQKIVIQGTGNYESLRLHFNDLIAIQSSDNYIEISFLDGNQLKKQLIRNTLSTIETEFPELFRTHRSFLINPYHFQRWKIENGKQGVLLSHGLFVPVSKTYQTEAKAQFHFATN